MAKAIEELRTSEGWQRWLGVWVEPHYRAAVADLAKVGRADLDRRARQVEGRRRPSGIQLPDRRLAGSRSFAFPYNVRVMEPTTSPKTRRIEVRLSDEERQLDAAAASVLGESLSDFFRRAAQARAQEVLADQRTIALSEVEAARFLKALEQPDEGTVARLEDLRRRA
jgi:uncharacterized protein (DUF1778 family)